MEEDQKVNVHFGDDDDDDVDMFAPVSSQPPAAVVAVALDDDDDEAEEAVGAAAEAAEVPDVAGGKDPLLDDDDDDVAVPAPEPAKKKKPAAPAKKAKPQPKAAAPKPAQAEAAAVEVSLVDSDEETAAPAAEAAAAPAAAAAAVELDADVPTKPAEKKKGKKVALPAPDTFVTVSEPEKHGEGLTPYVTFKVSTSTTRDAFPEKEFFVRRRYNDFLWLQTALSEESPFNTVPPLPEKNAMKRLDRFKPEFLERRRVGLEKFINRVARHPVHTRAPEFVAFLQAAQSELTSMKKAKSRNPFQRLSNAVKGAVDNLLMDNRDARFSIVTTYIEDLYKHLKHLDGSNQSELKAYRSMSDDYSDTGPVFKLLEETVEGDLAACCGVLSDIHNKLSELTLEKADKLESSWELGFHEYVVYCESIKKLLKRRDAAQLHTELNIVDLETKKEQKQKEEQKTPINTLKIAKLEKQIEELTEVVKQSNEEYVRANNTVLYDLRLWHRQKVVDIKSMLASWVRAQIEHHQESIKSLRAVKGTLDDTQ